VCDYEIGLRNAVQTVWPSSTVRGCQFHFKQSLWRALQRTDLVPEYNVLNSPVRKSFKILGAFPLLPEDQNLTDVKITQHMMKEPPPPRARKWVLYDEKLKRIVDDFENYELVDYLTAIGNLI